MTRRSKVAVVGAGPAGLMAAEVLARGGAEVVVYDRMPSPARKLLLAGRGGLNLSHSEGIETFRRRYGAAAAALGPGLDAFGPQALRTWCAGLGVDTFVGSSGRVFPASFKTSPLLRVWLRRLAADGVVLRVRHHWRGWDEAGRLRFDTPAGPTVEPCDAAILALGGASWPGLGSDGSWVPQLAAAGIDVAPLQPANCGFEVAWSETFRARAEGEPLKNVAVTFGGERARGDLVVTRTGLEGGPIYALARGLRAATAAGSGAVIHIALRPDLAVTDLAARLGRTRPKDSLSTRLRRALSLSPTAVGLLREAASLECVSLTALDPSALAERINYVEVRLVAAMPIARAISTAGGVVFPPRGLMLRPGLFAAGEMLDWEAPTGGYLLQACFATGAQAAREALADLATREGSAAPSAHRPIGSAAPSPT